MANTKNDSIHILCRCFLCPCCACEPGPAIALAKGALGRLGLPQPAQLAQVDASRMNLKGRLCQPGDRGSTKSSHNSDAWRPE